MEVFASSPSADAMERLRRVDEIGKLVLSYEASSEWLVYAGFSMFFVFLMFFVVFYRL